MKKYVIIAEDDEDDQFLIQAAWEECDTEVACKFVKDGLELMAMLEEAAEIPTFIIMDLNMPIKNGREVLAEIRASDRLSCLPVLVMSTSKAPFDIRSSYTAGANAYLVKPSTFTDLVILLRSALTFWADTATKAT